MGAIIGQSFDKVENYFSYGVIIDNRLTDSTLTRIGNLELHRTLPIQSGMRGCLLNDNGTVNYYLSATGDTSKEDGTPSVLDGSDGQVMVEIPEHYFISRTLDQYRTEIRISRERLHGYALIPKRYISKYKASLQRSTSKLSSVLNLTADYRGGNNNATNDANSKTLLGKPATVINLTNFRSYARNRGSARWNCSTYESHKSLYWLFVIEYANLNSQAPIAVKDPVTGFMQGGLGDGVTTANSTEWSNFNGSYPICPIGTTSSLGSSSGEISFTVEDFGGVGIDRTFKANRYRGIENPFGDILEWTDGLLIETIDTTHTLYTCSIQELYSSTVTSNYIARGVVPSTNNYISKMLLGSNGDILPSEVNSNYNLSPYKDIYNKSSSAGVFGVVFGGHTANNTNAGFVFAVASYGPSGTAAYIGSRFCYVIRC